MVTHHYYNKFTDCSWLKPHPDFDVGFNVALYNTIHYRLCTPIPSIDAKKVYFDFNEPLWFFKHVFKHDDDYNQESIENVINYFDLILTKKSALVSRYPNKCILMPFGTSLIEKENEIRLWENRRDKHFSTSFTSTAKPPQLFAISSGYTIRHHILSQIPNYNKDQSNRIVYYNSSKSGFEKNSLNSHLGYTSHLLPFHGDRSCLMEHMFHIAVENSREENYFTEKLVECLVCGTLPIYYGCTNIEDYFDTRGMILINSEDASEVFNVCSKLTKEDYFDRMSYIEENRNRALMYTDIRTRFFTTIKEYFK